MTLKTEQYFKYNWQSTKRYNSYSSMIKQIYGDRVQKLSIQAGFSCPNRDGSKSNLGCYYCDNSTFTPNYCSSQKTIIQQINEGVSFFSRKYKGQNYFAYFQAYTNTYTNVELLKKMIDEALSHSKIIGIILSTRPDCLGENIIEYLEVLNTKTNLYIELGIESTNDETLNFINRKHSFKDSIDAVNKLNNINIKTCAHLIIGLPYENKIDYIKHITEINKLKIHTLKLHQLQIIKNTILEQLYIDNINLIEAFTVETYTNLMCDLLEIMNPEIIVERFTSESPISKVITPKWNGIKNFEIVAKIEKELQIRNSYQGKYYNP